MKSRIAALGICGAVLIGLLTVYYSLGAQPETSEAVTEPEVYTLIDRNVDEMESFYISSGGESLSFIRDDEEQWRLADNENIPLDMNLVEGIAAGLASLDSETVLEASDEFGFGTPLATAGAVFIDGTSLQLTLGAKTPDGEYYYAMIDDGPEVYLISAHEGERYTHGLGDIADKSLPDIDTDGLQYAYIKNADQEIEISPKEGDGDLEDYGIASLQMTKPYPGREIRLYDFAQGVLMGLNDMKFDEVAETGQYGLDTPALEIRLRDSENEFYLLVGGDAGDGNFYAQGAGGIIFTISGEYLEQFKKIDVFSFMDRFVVFEDMSAVEKITIEESGEVKTILINSETAEDESVSYKPEIDGKEVDAEEFKTYYQSLIGLSYDSAVKDFTPETDPEFTVTYYLKDGSMRECVYYEYDTNFYAVRADGEPIRFVVNKQSVNTAQRLLRGLSED